MKIIYSIVIVILFLDNIKSEVNFEENEESSQTNLIQNSVGIENPSKEIIQITNKPERELYLRGKKSNDYNMPKDMRKLSKSQIKRIKKMYRTSHKRRKSRGKSKRSFRRIRRRNLNRQGRRTSSSRYTSLLSLFNNYIKVRINELAKGDELAQFWCAAKYCINNRNILKENPGSGEKYKAPSAFSMTENTSIVNRLQGEEIGIYNEYKSGLRKKHDNNNLNKLRDKCMEICKKEINKDINTRKTNYQATSSGKNNLKVFEAVDKSTECIKIRKADNNAKFAMLNFCKQVGTNTVESCWSTYGTAGIQACNFKYYQEHGYPYGHLSKKDKQSIESDNYNHALNYFTQKGTYACDKCKHTYPYYYRRYYCHFQYKTKECNYLYGKKRKDCIKKNNINIHRCNNFSYSVCVDKCTGGDKNYYYAINFKNKRPSSYGSISSVSQCQGECDKYNNLHNIYNHSQVTFKNWYNNNCVTDCKAKVASAQASSGSKAGIYNIKLNTFIGRVKNKQIERNKYDDQHIHKSKRMSLMYNRDAIFDAILLMENKIYEEQTTLTQTNLNKAQAYETEILNKILKLHANEKDFDKYDDTQMNIFDLKMN